MASKKTVFEQGYCGMLSKVYHNNCVIQSLQKHGDLKEVNFLCVWSGNISQNGRLGRIEIMPLGSGGR